MVKPVNPSVGTASWMFYDGANSIFHLIGITIMFPWVMVEYWHTISIRDPLAVFLGPWFRSGADAWSALVTIALLISGGLAYLAGRFADRNALRRWFVMIPTLLTIVSLVFVVGFFSPRIAALFPKFHFLLPLLCSIVFFTIALSLYDSMLIDAAGGQDKIALSKISGGGWGIGYVVSAFVLFILWCFGFFTAGLTSSDLTKILVIMTFLFATLSVIVFRLWPTELEVVPVQDHRGTERIKIPRFLWGAFFLTDATVTIAYFVTILSTKLFQQTLEETVALFLVVHAIAIVSTVWFAFYGGAVSSKIMCRGLGLSWLTVCVVAGFLMYFSYVDATLYFLVFSMGILIGVTPATLRSLYAEMIPAGRRSEYYAYSVVMQRSFAFVGPLAATVLLRYVSYEYFAIIPVILISTSLIIFWGSAWTKEA